MPRSGNAENGTIKAELENFGQNLSCFFTWLKKHSLSALLWYEHFVSNSSCLKMWYQMPCFINSFQLQYFICKTTYLINEKFSSIKCLNLGTLLCFKRNGKLDLYFFVENFAAPLNAKSKTSAAFSSNSWSKY